MRNPTLEELLNEPYAYCSSCKRWTKVIDNHLGKHSIPVNGFWLDAHSIEEIPVCPGSNSPILGEIRPYIQAPR